MKQVFFWILLFAAPAFAAPVNDQLIQQALKNNALTQVGKLDVVRFNLFSTAVQAKLNGKVGTTGSAQTLSLARIPGSTYSTVQHLQDIFHSAGYVSGGAITDAGGGAVNVAAGSGLIRATNSATSTIYYFNWPASNGLAITADTIRYVGIEYNSGSPRVTVRTSQNWDYRTDFPLGRVVNEGGTLHILLDPQAVGDHANTMIQREYDTMPLAYDMRTGGLMLGETGTRNLTLSAGALWDRLNKFTIPALNTSGAGRFDAYYQNGAGGFTRVASLSQWPNTQYDDGSGTLATLTASRYANLWFYLETDGALVMLYGRSQYTTLAAALAGGEPPTVPLRIQAHGRLIGRLTFQKSAATASDVASVFTMMLASSAVSNHASLSNLDFASSAHTGFQSAMTAGVDYLAPNGSAAGLTGFPTLNQNTTGSAAKLTTARTINGVSFDGTANIQTATAGTSDYVTGTFTPVFNTFTIVGSGTATGVFTKIGRMVFVQVKWVPTGAATIASTANASYIGGLPYVVGGTGFAEVMVSNGTNAAPMGSPGSAQTTVMLTPTWAATNSTISISTFYPM